MSNEKYSIVILAAGMGKRMKNEELPKVLVPLAGKPLIGHVLELTGRLSPEKTILIVGFRKERVVDYVASLDDCYIGNNVENNNNNKIKNNNILFAVQEEQLGTGHAVSMTEPLLGDYSGGVLILSGDVPLLKQKTVETFIGRHYSNNADLSVLSAEVADPAGYGRIVRDGEGEFLEIVEQKDASAEEEKITEINSGIYFVKAGLLYPALRKVKNNNAQGEYYLTDIVDVIRKEGGRISAIQCADFDELQGINSPEDLERALRFINNR